MKSYFVEHGAAQGRRMRMCAADRSALAMPLVWDAIALADSDEDDEARQKELARVISSGPSVTATTHRVLAAPGVLHVFVRDPRGGRLFACVLVSEERLEQMLSEAPTVLEGSWFQVAPTRNLRPSAVRAALDAWTERNFTGDVVGGAFPSFDVSAWPDPDDLPFASDRDPVRRMDEVSKPELPMPDPAWHEAA